MKILMPAAVASLILLIKRGEYTEYTFELRSGNPGVVFCSPMMISIVWYTEADTAEDEKYSSDTE
jgi:hypothetical protein